MTSKLPSTGSRSIRAYPGPATGSSKDSRGELPSAAPASSLHEDQLGGFQSEEFNRLLDCVGHVDGLDCGDPFCVRTPAENRKRDHWYCSAEHATVRYSTAHPAEPEDLPWLREKQTTLSGRQFHAVVPPRGRAAVG